MGKKIRVGNFEIGDAKTFVIADIGSNHKQDLQLAKESIDAVVEAGADAVKFQSIQLEELYINPNRETSEFIKKLEFPEFWHTELQDYCNKKGIVFFSSPTYFRAVDLLEDADVSLYKLASAQIGTFPQLVERVAALGKPTIFSTGIADYEEITQAVKIFKKHNNDQYIILHCNSIYPTPPERVNLRLMGTYKRMFGNPVGFSDHTDGIQVALAAVAMGANVIEKHFTLRRDLGTPDCSSFACDPEQLRNLVDGIRDIEVARDGMQDRLHIQNEERQFKDAIRYRLVAVRQIEVGERLSDDNLIYKRNTEGIDCREFFLSKDSMVVRRTIPKGTLINLDDIN